MNDDMNKWDAWADVNHQRHYSLTARIKRRLERFDAWWHDHPWLVTAAAVIGLTLVTVAAVNLALERPWF